MENVAKKENWRQRRAVFGKIKIGQLWQKRDTGRVLVIKGRGKDNTWWVNFNAGEKGHHIKERDLYAHYEKLT